MFRAITSTAGRVRLTSDTKSLGAGIPTPILTSIAGAVSVYSLSMLYYSLSHIIYNNPPPIRDTASTQSSAIALRTPALPYTAYPLSKKMLYIQVIYRLGERGERKERKEKL